MGVIKSGRVLLGGARCPAAGTGREPAKSAHLVRADGRVRAIEITCSCGEVTLLEIDYDEEAAASEPAPPAA